MPDIICILPKELIIGQEYRRRTAKYTIHTTEHEITWEDHERGLIAKNAPAQVAKLFAKNDGFVVVNQPSDLPPRPAPVDLKPDASRPQPTPVVAQSVLPENPVAVAPAQAEQKEKPKVVKK